jgi:hypothetical protein
MLKIAAPASADTVTLKNQTPTNTVTPSFRTAILRCAIDHPAP